MLQLDRTRRVNNKLLLTAKGPSMRVAVLVEESDALATRSEIVLCGNGRHKRLAHERMWGPSALKEQEAAAAHIPQACQ